MSGYLVILAGLLFFALPVVAFALPVVAAEAPPPPSLQLRIASTLQSGKPLRVAGIELSARQLIPALYQATQFQPVWTDEKKVDQLLAAIEDMSLDGLDPQDYYLDRLKQLRAEVLVSHDQVAAIDLDLLYSDALARLLYHAHFGKADPERLDDSWNIQNEWKGKRGPAAVLELIKSPSLQAAVESLKPQRPHYQRLRAALAKYRAYQAAGDWGTIPTGVTIAPDKSDPRIPKIRRRLASSEDLAKELDNGVVVFDAELQKAVTRFQTRHDLPLGAIDSNTIRTMNMPAKVWINQLRVNLERARWIMPIDDPTYLMVNIAAFELDFVRDGKRVWRTDVQVGRTYSKTPLFRSLIKYFVLNPTWTVPPGVMAETVLPGAQHNPGYLRERGLQVLDDAGHEVTPESVAWKKFTAETLPYTIRQTPGEGNALGVVKFMFPNKYHVYLHDTPNKAGYGARVRTMSWGCIHVKDPLELAAHMAAGTTWSLETIQKQVKSGKSATVFLTKPVPVYLLYWTAEVPEGGELLFHADVYDRDRSVLAMLNRPARLRKEKRRVDEEQEVTQDEP
jgi:murein L,D-transpeptidase YcbB/YkuD